MRGRVGRGSEALVQGLYGYRPSLRAGSFLLPSLTDMPTLSPHDDGDQDFMQLALEQGRRALPGCLPNPPVGCVLVKNGRVIASGFTQPPGQYHAEAMALACLPEELSSDLSDVTAFVTLEPCSFHGRTPSCATALVARGIGRVVVAALDPDPRNAGKGIDILQAAGVEVTMGVRQEQALEDLGPYLGKS